MKNHCFKTSKTLEEDKGRLSYQSLPHVGIFFNNPNTVHIFLALSSLN
jgi:hypothetical protein